MGQGESKRICGARKPFANGLARHWMRSISLADIFIFAFVIKNEFHTYTVYIELSPTKLCYNFSHNHYGSSNTAYGFEGYMWGVVVEFGRCCGWGRWPSMVMVTFYYRSAVVNYKFHEKRKRRVDIEKHTRISNPPLENLHTYYKSDNLNRSTWDPPKPVKIGLFE